MNLERRFFLFDMPSYQRLYGVISPTPCWNEKLEIIFGSQAAIIPGPRYQPSGFTYYPAVIDHVSAYTLHDHDNIYNVGDNP